MANVTTQTPAITEASPLSPAQIYANGLQLAKEVDKANRKAGKPTHHAEYFRKTWGPIFGGK